MSAGALPNDNMSGRIDALYTAPEAGEPMANHDRVTLVSGGIEGDRYLRGTGYYSPFDVCEVTLVDAAVLETVRDDLGTTSPTAGTAGTSSSAASTSTTC